MKIGIIGAGWFGSHLSCVLKRKGYDVTLFEKNQDIFHQVSGQFGIRLHAGPHYPRSLETRKCCRRGFEAFKKAYPDLIVDHLYSIYALGDIDANGFPSKVSASDFQAICEEHPTCRPIDIQSRGYQNLLAAFDIEEPSMVIGEQLRTLFWHYFREAGVQVLCNYEVKKIESIGSKFIISNDIKNHVVDVVINATGYQSFLPRRESFPFDMELVFQPCLGLIYKDNMPEEKPFSFVVMDGWFPCIMPLLGDMNRNKIHKYVLTHGKWTIMGSYQTAEAAHELLNKLDDKDVQKYIRQYVEKEMNRFWPIFGNRFSYLGWRGGVLAKLKTKREFRSAVTFRNQGVIHIIPGKISNVFDAEREVLCFLNEQDIKSISGFDFVKGGVFEDSLYEIIEKPSADEQNTCTLQTFQEIKSMCPLTNVR